MSYEPIAATLVTYAIIGCILLLTAGAILCFPGPPTHREPVLRRTDHGSGAH